MLKTTCADIPKGSQIVSLEAKKGLTGYCFKYIDRPFCFRTDEMLERSCDVCDKSPSIGKFPVHLDKEKADYTLRVLRRRCTCVCRSCSDNLADLVKQQTNLSQSGACSETVLQMQASNNSTGELEQIGSGGSSENTSESAHGNDIRTIVLYCVGSGHELAEMQQSIQSLSLNPLKTIDETLSIMTDEKVHFKCF